MNPLSPQVKSVEAFQRDLEPAIIAARNELVTAENFMAYKNSYSIDTYDKDGKTICSFHSRMFFFTELDTDLTTSACCPSDSSSPKIAGPPAELRSLTTCGLTRNTTPRSPRRHDWASKPPPTTTHRTLQRTGPLATRRR